ncbi:hypothetical protein [Hydrogenophaga sp. NFH-34]|uniref:hypothetical protein n=1 Tax=Hydrogenophaga sp. NFH-34 TaxID=2744446 RepID=UPI001F2D6137|nr:hypothetical protein [Hydrogenophaga sp. NFH-34]
MKLYRGDSVPSNSGSGKAGDRGRTFAEYFVSNGLMAKFSDGGSCALLDGKDLIDLVLAHVGYEQNGSEKALAYRSPMLSFSECESTALKFTTGRRKAENFNLCSFEDATHFVWMLQVDLPEESSAGVFELGFEADAKNLNELIDDQLHRSRLRQAETGDMSLIPVAIMNRASAQLAAGDKSEHRAILVNVVRMLSAIKQEGRNPLLLSNTIVRASRDKQWLLYPSDPMPDGSGLSSRFPMNIHLHIHKYFRATPR